MLRHRFKQMSGVAVLSMALLFLGGCASYTGIRPPRYDGQTIEQNDEAIMDYQDHSQVAEEDETLYVRYPLSKALWEPSYEFSDNESLELNEGTYTVGEDLPEGRVYLQGESSDFSPDRWIIHTANVIIRDREEAVVFEQHFQDDVGVMQAVVDLREGQTITLTGNDPIVFVSYTDASAAMMDQSGEESESITLLSGHYEVGNQIEAGEYTIDGVISPRASELYIFSGESDQTIIELHSRLNPYHLVSAEENQELLNLRQITPDMYEMNELNRERFEDNKPTLILNEGDTLYLPMVNQLILEKN
ncbi:MAG: hypothetical protein JJU16_00990 [Alkalibacterium sp.]|nr:hypothetical protein [Alkalibacterium sp.]